MGGTGRTGNYFRSFTLEEVQYGIYFHWGRVVVADCHGAGHRPFLDCKNGTKGAQAAAGNDSANTVFCGIINDK